MMANGWEPVLHVLLHRIVLLSDSIDRLFEYFQVQVDRAKGDDHIALKTSYRSDTRILILLTANLKRSY